MEIDSKQHLINMSLPEVTPDDAKRMYPVWVDRLQECTDIFEEAHAATAQCEARASDNREYGQFLLATEKAVTLDRDELTAKFEEELRGLRGACDVEANASILRAKQNALDSIALAYARLVDVTEPTDHITHLDAIVRECEAELDVFQCAANVHRLQTIAALGSVWELQGGNVGIIGGQTEQLREAARICAARLESARTAAREARLRYDERIATGVSARLVRGSTRVG